MSNSGRIFQEHTSHQRQADSTSIRPVSVSSQPQVLQLPTPAWDRLHSLGHSLLQRRSNRRYFGPIDLEEVSLILAASYGKSGEDRRSVPSAGGLYPLDVKLVVNAIDQLEMGIYQYCPEEHSLVLRNTGAWGEELSGAALGQKMCGEASCVLAFSAVFPRATYRYGQRAYRYVYLDAGHAVQNTYLAAAALGLGCCGIAAFYDDEVNRLFGADGTTEAVIYMAAVGRVAQS